MNESPTPSISDSIPRLWNPNAAACWSLVFSPAFGAILHARNAECLGRTNEAKANKVWIYITIAYLGVGLISIFVPAIPDAVFRWGNIGLLLGWYSSLGKQQIAYVKGPLQNRYQRKPWTKPLLIAVGCLAGFIVVVVILAIIAEALLGTE